jgi:glycosyltransferase involved in cell wall biosynthesis
MRVLQVMAGGPKGGAETFFVELVRALQRDGVQQEAAIRRHPERAAALRAGGVTVRELPFAGGIDPFTPFRLRRIAKAFRPDVAVAWMGRAAAALPRGPWVNVGRLGGWYDLKRFRSCDELVCNTRGIVEWCVAQGWPAERAHYIPNFLVWHPRDPMPRAALDTPADALVLLSLGRLHVNKAFDVAIRALAMVPNAYYWLAGEGELRADLGRIAREAGVADQVRFLGWRDDKEALLAAADLCLVPSREEPFGNVVLDAWASGRALIVADSAGPRKFVHDGEDCLLTPVDDAAALAAAIVRLRDDRDLCHRLAVNGYRRWQAEFTEEVAVRNWRSFLEEAVARCAA